MNEINETIKRKNDQDCDCISCEEGLPTNECLNSKRKCGHHCNHAFTHDSCCWCNYIFGSENV